MPGSFFAVLHRCPHPFFETSLPRSFLAVFHRCPHPASKAALPHCCFAALHRCLTECPEHRCLALFLRCCIGALIHIPNHRSLTVFLQCPHPYSENVRNTVASLFYFQRYVGASPNVENNNAFAALHRCREARVVHSCAFKLLRDVGSFQPSQHVHI